MFFRKKKESLNIDVLSDLDKQYCSFLVKFMTMTDHKIDDVYENDIVYKICKKIPPLNRFLLNYRFTILITQFTCGYCYFFACILKDIYKRGNIVWCCPFDHIAWMDADGKVYDILGQDQLIKRKKNPIYIPIEDHMDTIFKNYKQIPDKDGKHIYKQKWYKYVYVYIDYCYKNNLSIDKQVIDMIKNIHADGKHNMVNYNISFKF